MKNKKKKERRRRTSPWHHLFLLATGHKLVQWWEEHVDVDTRRRRGETLWPFLFTSLLLRYVDGWRVRRRKAWRRKLFSLFHHPITFQNRSGVSDGWWCRLTCCWWWFLDKRRTNWSVLVGDQCLIPILRKGPRLMMMMKVTLSGRLRSWVASGWAGAGARWWPSQGAAGWCVAGRCGTEVGCVGRCYLVAAAGGRRERRAPQRSKQSGGWSDAEPPPACRQRHKVS